MKKVEAAGAETEKTYQAIAKALEPLGVVQSKMFGMPALKANGKAFAGLFGDAIVFKLKDSAHAEAMALAGAELFDPSGMGRPMKEWIVVPSAHRSRWKALGQRALESLDGVPAGTAAKKTPSEKRAAPKKTPSEKRGAPKKLAIKKAKKTTPKKAKKSPAK
jgi:hypothetical protein